MRSWHGLDRVADCGPAAADAFADAASQEETTAGVDYVHIRVQQRNGKKSLTTVQVRGRSLLPWLELGSLLQPLPPLIALQGLKKSYDYKKVLKALKKGARRSASSCLCRCAFLVRSDSHLPAPSVAALAEFCCNGTVVDDPELGQVSTKVHAQRFPGNSLALLCPCIASSILLVMLDLDVIYVRLKVCHGAAAVRVCMQVIQLQGDQRKNVLQFLTQEGLVKKDLIKIHGF
jgi:translation initiation factor 1 (eIF-1/SUI1)